MTAKKEILKNGQVHISTDVLSIITSIAAGEIEGVQDASSGFVDEISSLFNKKTHSKGIKIELKEDNVYIDININVEYGYNIHEVAEAVQKKITEKIETMTNLNVVSINVNVSNVYLKEEKEKEIEEALQTKKKKKQEKEEKRKDAEKKEKTKEEVKEETETEDK